MKAKYIFVASLMLLGLVSCDKFLDTLPDNRTELDSAEKIRSLLMSAYPQTDYLGFNEMMSDNADCIGENNPYTMQIFDQIWSWSDVTEEWFECPAWVWEHSYMAIAAANQVILAIDEGGGAYYEKTLAEQGIIYLGYVHNGMRQISNRVWPVRTPEDLKFLKIRISGNVERFQFFASLGALPVPMSWSELPAALRQGVVDGYETGFIMSHSAELEQYTKYTTVLNYAYETYLFIANSKAFDQLEPKTRQLLRDKADEACAWGRREIARQEEDSRQIFVENGIVVTELSAEERDAFKEKSRDIVKYLKREYGKEACRAFGIPFEP